MNSIQVFLDKLQAQNIQLWVEEDRLRYRCPNNAFTPDLTGQLSEHKSEIIAFLREQQQSENIPGTEDDFIPLPFAQQRLWFLDQLEPNLAVYNTPLALRLEGKLNISALEKSLEKIVERHSPVGWVRRRQNFAQHEKCISVVTHRNYSSSSCI
ncbi:condensation domain-containing protein [Nodularia spumigena]|uniref:TubC N-terminal docking domain-related protein n=1 Tax=Nodularia spumigena TaxID=70799 RepID=UPI002330B486|nr:condensation domain-containing protein [Nodularia spumigena]MDB9320014.1 condensation domain-containing protein [Nodularia spumigena CS-590/01A]MDB9328725.1 condensation domain-containing protein [Nodularia spumigena CS-590/02]MDB9337457.1 condensation domain-containing protein [Nodularia spumigena CS-590/01]MDB9362108.1 condensation domain-containing protein [Nodularia spumigena CS-588/02]MDB9364878.1 condensation domain-containing protein [Nodularia spumigena CS-588/02A10]